MSKYKMINDRYGDSFVVDSSEEFEEIEQLCFGCAHDYKAPIQLYTDEEGTIFYDGPNGPEPTLELLQEVEA